MAVSNRAFLPKNLPNGWSSQNFWGNSELSEIQGPLRVSNKFHEKLKIYDSKRVIRSEWQNTVQHKPSPVANTQMSTSDNNFGREWQKTIQHKPSPVVNTQISTSHNNLGREWQRTVQCKPSPVASTQISTSDNSGREWQKIMLCKPSPVASTQISTSDKNSGVKGDDWILPVVDGDLTSSEYRKTHVAIVQVNNCVAVRPHGLSETLAKSYPFGNCYKKRSPILDMNRACIRDRPIPGTIDVCKIENDTRSPVIVNLFAQVYMGKAYPINVHSRKLVDQMYSTLDKINRSTGVAEIFDLPIDFDYELLKAVETDTVSNRLAWFKKALNNLEKSLAASETITKIAFPYGIACGLAGGNWETDYYPAIKQFAKNIFDKYNIKTVLVRKVEFESAQMLAVKGLMKYR